jgi:hypothetical protein
MSKVALIIGGVLIAGLIVLVSPFVYHGLQISSQRRALLNRSDFPQIAATCVALARAVTNDSPFIKPTDSIIPPLLRSLSPKYINASSNSVTMEFHGGFDHYGYRVRQSDTNAKLWTISWYTEQGERLLTTISHE